MSQEGFEKAVVYLAQKGVEGSSLSQQEKLVLLLHHMNNTTGALRLMGTRVLFPVTEEAKALLQPIPGSRHKIRAWSEVFDEDDGGRESRFDRGSVRGTRNARGSYRQKTSPSKAVSKGFNPA